jgi:molybdopterin converting factor small subunit
MRRTPQPLFRALIMQVLVHFYSYFKDLAGCAETVQNVSDGSTIGDLLRQLTAQYPKLAGMQNSTLIAIGVEYQDRACVLKPGDEVSLFPPVQGG